MMFLIIVTLASAAMTTPANQAVENPFGGTATPITAERPRPMRRRTATTRRTAPKTKAVAYYANCSAARAAGAAPVRRGEPGYSRKLDRDNDGVGCE